VWGEKKRSNTEKQEAVFVEKADNSTSNSTPLEALLTHLWPREGRDND